jgi:hypothetical protein
MLKTEGAVLLQGVLNQDEVDVARPHIAGKHLAVSRDRSYLDTPYARLKDPVGRYEVLGDLSDEVERELVNTIMGRMSDIFQKIVGLDGVFNEFSYITQCKCSMQTAHSDLCSYDSDIGNEGDYCNEYYSLILAMQHTPPDMGGTEVWPRTHKRHTDKGVPKHQIDKVVRGQFNAGDAMLYNQKLVHRGGQNLVYQSRIMTVFVIASQKRGGPPGNDRNYKMGEDIDHAKQNIKTLGARREYMHKKYVPDDAEYCRAECPFVPKQPSIGIPYQGRLIKRFYYWTGKIKIGDFPLRDSAHLKDVLDSVKDEI